MTSDFDRLGNDPYLIGATFGAELQDVVTDGGARLAVSRSSDRGQLHGIGPAPALGSLLARVLKDPGIELHEGAWAWLTPGAAEAAGVLAPSDGEGALGARGIDEPGPGTGGGIQAASTGPWRLRKEWDDWYWMGHTGETPRLGGEPDRHVTQLDPVADAAEIEACLAIANPEASLTPGDPDLRRWWGFRHEGRLLGVIADAQHGAHRLYELHSLGTLPEARGHGVGGALLRRSVADQLAVNERLGYRMAILGVFAGNKLALEWYRRFGFGEPYARASFALARA